LFGPSQTQENLHICLTFKPCSHRPTCQPLALSLPLCQPNPARQWSHMTAFHLTQAHLPGSPSRVATYRAIVTLLLAAAALCTASTTRSRVLHYHCVSSTGRCRRPCSSLSPSTRCSCRSSLHHHEALGANIVGFRQPPRAPNAIGLRFFTAIIDNHCLTTSPPTDRS
jgi:hypothetical protein